MQNRLNGLNILMLVLVTLAVGCVRSATPNVEDLVRVRAPTFNQSISALITTPSIAYTVRGECDSDAYLTEYSLDDGAWTKTDCVNGAFSFPVRVPTSIKVNARARGKFSYSDISRATIRFLPAPTSNSIYAVSSSKSDASDQVGVGTQNVLGSTFEGNTASNGALKIQTYMPRTVYEP